MNPNQTRTHGNAQNAEPDTHASRFTFHVLLLAFTFAALAPLATRAQTPNPPGLISYQGFLTDGNGIPLATNTPRNYNVVFRIWNAGTGGSNVWAEQQVVTVDRGYFTVMLGSGSSVGAFWTNNLSSLFSGADASDRYLEMQPQVLTPTDPPIFPRLRLLASPYAFLAANALNASNATTAVRVSGANIISATNLASNIGVWTTAGTNLFYTNGNVGIGTTTPNAPLQVANGNNKVWLNSSNLGNSGGGLVSVSRGDDGGEIGFLGASAAPSDDTVVCATGGGAQLRLAGASGGIGFYPNTGFTGAFAGTRPTAAMTLDSNGRLGIGVINPQNSLSVMGSACVDYGGANVGTTANMLSFGGAGSGEGIGSQRQGGSPASGQFGLEFYTAGANRMTVLQNGLVGIGTPTPGYLLDVNGAGHFNGALSSAGTVNAYAFRGQNGTGGTLSYYDVSFYVGPGAAGGVHLWLANNDLGSINTTPSDRRLKEQINPMADGALAKVRQLRPVTFKFKHLPDSLFDRINPGLQEGFIADELQAVIPSGVNGQKDAVSSNGTIQPQTLNPMPVVAVLAKAVQELSLKVDTQQAELSQLRADLAKLRNERKTLAQSFSDLQARDEAREARLVRLEKALDKQAAAATSKRAKTLEVTGVER